MAVGTSHSEVRDRVGARVDQEGRVAVVSSVWSVRHLDVTLGSTPWKLRNLGQTIEP